MFQESRPLVRPEKWIIFKVMKKMLSPVLLEMFILENNVYFKTLKL